jgi:Predicted membrane protein involved in D-alanine export
VLFNSLEYLIFLPLVFIVYWLLNKNLKLQNNFLFVASYVFYGWWDWRFLGLLMLSTIIDYSFGFLVDTPNERRRKMFMWLSVFNNLIVLCVFKYYNFFVLETQQFMANFGINFSPYVLKVVLPVGISFYTFHGMSYVLDIYRGKSKPVKSFVDYSLFVSFFPLLVAGPIERAWHLLPQIQRKRKFDYNQARDGIGLMVYGFFKKIVISDTIAETVNSIFATANEQTSLSLVIGAVLFSFQIYADFSGYSDIALGTSKLLGFELLSNFKFPYFSRNIAEFWRRWHISLSSWFRDYVYIPLGGSKGSKFKSIRNVMIIFLLSGFWHGANMTYIVWGLIHGLLFLPIFLLNNNRKKLDEVVATGRTFPTIKELLQIAITFSTVTIAWIFFRSPTIDVAISYIGNMFTKPFTTQGMSLLTFQALLYPPVLLFFDWLNRYNERQLAIFNYKHKWLRTVLYVFFVILIFSHINLLTTQKDFIYFQF